MLSVGDVLKRKCKNIPDSIYTAIDDLIIEKYKFPEGKAIITFDDLFDRVKLVYSDREQVIDWFKSAVYNYEPQGWEITESSVKGGAIVFKGG